MAKNLFGLCEKPGCSDGAMGFSGPEAMRLCDEHMLEWMHRDLQAFIDAEEDEDWDDDEWLSPD